MESVGPGCAALLGAHSEGSKDAPLVVAFDDTPYLGGLRYRDGPSYYRVTGLDVGARYALGLSGAFRVDLGVFQAGFSGTTACSVQFEGEPECTAVAQGDSLDVAVFPVSVRDEGECFTMEVGLDSPRGAFEGAPDDLFTLRYGTPDLPHRGIVDHDRSYYRISELTAGNRYTVYMTGRDDDAQLIVGPEDPDGGVVNSQCLVGETNENSPAELSCTFEADSDTVGLEIWHYGSITSSKYVLSAFEEPASEGAVQAPVVLSYDGGLEYDGQVAHRTGDLEWGTSYYEVEGVTAGETYLASLTDAAGLKVSVYEDSGYETAATCDTQASSVGLDCALTASGSSLFVAVQSYSERSRRFRLNVHQLPGDEGDSSAPLALAYPEDFPYSGQVSWSSEYLVSGLPSGPLAVSLASTDGPVGFSAWAADSSTLDCSGAAGKPLCTLEGSAAGQMRLRASGIGHFDLEIAKAPLLFSQHTSASAATAIPNGDAAGLSSDLEVRTSPVTSLFAVTVELFVRHGRPSELEAYLMAPDGSEVKLANKGGSSYEGVRFEDYALDEFSGLISDAASARRPAEPLHALEGMDANGTWTLRLVDDEVPNIQDNDGELLGWGLSFR